MTSRTDVMRVLHADGPMTAHEIAAALGHDPAGVSSTCSRMYSDHILTRIWRDAGYASCYIYDIAPPEVRRWATDAS